MSLFRRRSRLAETAMLVNATMKVEEFLATLPPDCSMPNTRTVLDQIHAAFDADAEEQGR